VPARLPETKPDSSEHYGSRGTERLLQPALDLISNSYLAIRLNEELANELVDGAYSKADVS